MNIKVYHVINSIIKRVDVRMQAITAAMSYTRRIKLTKNLRQVFEKRRTTTFYIKIQSQLFFLSVCIHNVKWMLLAGSTLRERERE